MRPRIFYRSGTWYCRAGRLMGWGDSPLAAWECWRAAYWDGLRRLRERATRAALDPAGPVWPFH